MHFFIPLQKIPSATHQMKKITVRNGRPFVYEPPEVKQVRSLFLAQCSRFVPDSPMTGPVALTTQWLYPTTASHPVSTWKSTKPDTDNLVKMLKDVLTTLHFWHDDAQVASECIQKFYAGISGIYIQIDLLGGTHEPKRNDCPGPVRVP